MENQICHYIQGRKVSSTSDNFKNIYNPATGSVQRKVPLASQAEVKSAINTAEAAFDQWSQTPAAKRASIMFKYRQLLLDHTSEIATLISQEHGKTIADAKGEIARGIEVVEFACNINQYLKGEFSDSVANNIDTYSIRQPLGVVAGITPFNFPVMVPLWMFPIAISCGNTFILKPSEIDPSATLKIVELLHEAGLPAGVLNLVNGDKVAVNEILQNKLVKAISFVGSTAVGKYIYTEGCKYGKRVQALCGAKNHMLIMPDADQQKICDALMGAAFGSAGERCMAISVAVTVNNDNADQIVANLAERIKKLKIASYEDPQAEMGPVVSQAAYEKISKYIKLGVEQGAKIIVDGRSLKLAGYENGYFLGGTLFDYVTTDMDIYKDEIFGPVLIVVRAKNYEEALKIINDHNYGNGAAIFTEQGSIARNFSIRIKAGMVGVNVPIPVPVAYHSFGGWKDSLLGDHHMHGPEGVRFYTKLKTITQRFSMSQARQVDYHFKAAKEG